MASKVISVSTFSPSPGVQLSPPVLKTMLDTLQTPLIVKHQIQQWMLKTPSWKAIDLCNLLGRDGKKTLFKICPREGSNLWKKSFKETDVIFETHCEYVEATFSDFAEWLTEANQSTTEPLLKKMKINAFTEKKETEISSNPLLRYSSNEYWVYADYKYMCHVCTDHPEVLAAVNWSLFGLDSSDGMNSTIWVGSEGAFTPCHYDTYGSNIVAQLSGTKKWTLFSPSDTDCLYPTRVPYEESSIFSSVNVINPDVAQYPLFVQATAYTVSACELQESVHMHEYQLFIILFICFESYFCSLFRLFWNLVMYCMCQSIGGTLCKVLDWNQLSVLICGFNR